MGRILYCFLGFLLGVWFTCVHGNRSLAATNHAWDQLNELTYMSGVNDGWIQGRVQTEGKLYYQLYQCVAENERLRGFIVERR
jgi:hypothetical protein